MIIWQVQMREEFESTLTYGTFLKHESALKLAQEIRDEQRVAEWQGDLKGAPVKWVNEVSNANGFRLWRSVNLDTGRLSMAVVGLEVDEE